MIVTRKWTSCAMGLSAFSSAIKTLLEEYCRLQVGFYLPSRFRGLGTVRYLITSNPLVRFSPHCVIGSGISFIDLGAGGGISFALVPRTPAVRITAVEPNARMTYVLSKIWLLFFTRAPLCRHHYHASAVFALLRTWLPPPTTGSILLLLSPRTLSGSVIYML